ncbi:MAG: AI-2E family transporter [bacterium]
MNTDFTKTRASKIIIIGAALVIIAAGMNAAQSLIVPFLLAAFIAIICSPPLIFLQRKGFPAWLALVVVILGIAVIGSLVAIVIGTSINDFTDKIPHYQARLQITIDNLQQWMSNRGITISEETISEYLNVSAIFELVKNVLAGMGGILTNGFLIILTIIFVLLEASSMPSKIKAAFGNYDSTSYYINKFISKVKKYMAIKSLASLATGIIITIWLIILDVDFPLLWGLVAFMLNFVPNIGSIIAAIPAIMLSYLQIGFGSALLTTIGYLTVNVVIGNFIEPRYMGKGLGLSTLVVFTSLVFWGFILGPIGMFLSVPLTMTLKIALQSNPNTRWLAILLGDETLDDLEHKDIEVSAKN